ncbi:hypothetical protein PHYBLDRAFT_186013 [Phycomyces blakesleeanus NRRL 1555(-)]|uniref:CxC1-like cysteine cluster associated with KDZ transposases domain-containing protein n=1 Tax=Phycomyces blakesleeanus (strain ATCC 8743b / DSM 1359 / FGSC 10004 / NBRC 33097 / NRRL 1555) TaxID=763407 RepID=A0A167NFD0_PHYB8|nr:hypothetical protein PHYBLDRAFT_186013 [Phycomyces blakesleeanus NRRL 1555(-)]OAD75770.1 hypothetical protein PHYBLDRAFT_186013 [Phycomyces blakesleeanus NRRL 1555(-)]|eukprot:XP_018293810.1 hypothetical protein PHYBLDRAFT_186013 [Phycomyces blakesleeanus NRRL 1555(-)]
MYNPSKRTIKRRQRTAVPQFLLDYFSEDVPISGLNYIPTENPSVSEAEFSSPRLKYTYTRKKRARTMAVAPVETPSENIAASQTDLDVEIDFDTYEASQTQKRSLYNKWVDLLPQLADSFLRYLGRCKDGCLDKKVIAPLSHFLCSCTKFSKKNIYMFFLHSSGTFEVVFCGCKSIPEQLVEMGMLPASLNNVQYAIHFGLLEFMRDMRDVLATSGQGLADLYNKINLGAERQISKAYCQNLLHVFIRLTMIVEAKVEKLSPGFRESNCCPACPDVDSNVAVDDCRYVAMDGNFSLKCERRKDGEGDVGEELEQVEAQLKQVWIGDDVVKTYEKERAEEGVGRFDSNFHAGSGSLAKSIKYPIKGLFAASCARHESVIKLVDMETGEGFKYPLSIINQLLGDSGSDGQSADNSPNINVMYDVVCKLAKSLKANFPGLMEKSKLAVPIFHAYAHVQHCQVKLNPKYRDGFGLTDGECLERLWSYLNRFVTMTRKMGQANRKLVLYRAIKFRNETKKVELGLMLESKYVKAKRIIEESRKALEGFDCVVIEREWKQHVNKVEKSENYVDIADLMESGRKVQGNIALFLVNFTILRRLRELANDANGNHVKDEINRLKHEMEKLKAKIQEEVEGFQEPDEENTNLIKYIEENAQLGYNEFLAYKKTYSKMRLEPMFERIMIPRHCFTNLAISAQKKQNNTKPA